MTCIAFANDSLAVRVYCVVPNDRIQCVCLCSWVDGCWVWLRWCCKDTENLFSILHFLVTSYNYTYTMTNRRFARTTEENRRHNNMYNVQHVGCDAERGRVWHRYYLTSPVRVFSRQHEIYYLPYTVHTEYTQLRFHAKYSQRERTHTYSVHAPDTIVELAKIRCSVKKHDWRRWGMPTVIVFRRNVESSPRSTVTEYTVESVCRRQLALRWSRKMCEI